MIPLAAAMMAGGVISARSASETSARSVRLSRQAAQNQWQWTVADMRKAGLNPMLAFSQGPNQVQQPDLQVPGEHFARGVSSAAQIALQGKLAQSTIGLQGAQAEAALASANAANASARQTQVQTNKMQADYNWETRFRLDEGGGLDSKGQPIPSYFQEEMASRRNIFRKAGFNAREAAAAAHLVEMAKSGATWEDLKNSELVKMFKGSSGAKRLAILMSFLASNVSSAVRLAKP